MVDAEVLRLRRLRDAALGARALVRAMDPAGADRALTQSALLCWSISKLAAGRLRAHPYPDYQRDQNAARSRWDELTASLEAGIARRLRREHQILADDLKSVARELDRTRALTLLQDLSDAFGRMQLRLRTVLDELEQRARSAEEPVHAEARVLQGRETSAASSTIPYLSLAVGE